MRVTSALFTAALVRRAFAAGAAAAIMSHGADEAGAIFVLVDRLDGTADLYAPAPQSAFEGAVEDRLFSRTKAAAPMADIDAALARERRFDPDIWVVAIEDREGRSFVELAKG